MSLLGCQFLSPFLLFFPLFSLQWVMIFKCTWPVLKTKVVSVMFCLWVWLSLNWCSRTVPRGEVAWSGDLLGLLILVSEGKGEWNLKVLIVFGSRYPNCTSWKEGGLERGCGYKPIGKQALLFWLIVDHLTWTLKTRRSGFSDLFVPASWTVLICSFAHTHKIKILSIHFSLTCFWQSDKQVKNRASS